MTQHARIGKSSPVISQVNVARVTLRSQGMQDWQQAVNSGRSVISPRRKAIYELYDNLGLDGHWSAVVGKRTMNVTNKRVVWLQEGIKDDALQLINENIIETPWFYDFLTNGMSVVPFGTTLLELVPEKGMIAKCEVVPRANVSPEFGHIAQDASSIETPWIKYREDPYFSRYLIEVGKPHDLGAMLIALPYLMWKRGAFADFAQFSELFGMPFRVGKYNPWDDSTRRKLMEALSQMGGAGYAVIPDGTELDFHNGQSGQNQGGVYKDLVEMCNSEMSKLILGNTLTTEQGDKGARSLGEVHKGVEDDITLADMRRMEFMLNWELQPRLAALGYKVDAGKFAFDVTVGLPLEKRIDLDVKVAKQIPFPESYWYETYGIPTPSAEEVDRWKEKQAREAFVNNTEGRTARKQGKETTDPPTDAKKEDTPDAGDEGDQGDTAAFYAGLCTHGNDKAADGPADDSDPIMEELAKAIHDGRIRDGYVDPKLMKWTADQLTKAIMGGDTIGDQEEVESMRTQAMMRSNVMVFSGFKTYATLRAATDELMDENGQFRSFSDFKKRVLAIDGDYNKNYLRAEYQHAIACAQGAERWRDAVANKEAFPFLRWSTAGDDRVTPEDQAREGITLPVDHHYWDTNWIPSHWGCRCDIEQVASTEGGKGLPAGWSEQRDGMFANNVGKTGVVFPKTHPYYKAPRAIEEQVQQTAIELLPDPPEKLIKAVMKRLKVNRPTAIRMIKTGEA